MSDFFLHRTQHEDKTDLCRNGVISIQSTMTVHVQVEYKGYLDTKKKRQTAESRDTKAKVSGEAYGANSGLIQTCLLQISVFLPAPK
jgi:hypothetical protein